LGVSARCSVTAAETVMRDMQGDSRTRFSSFFAEAQRESREAAHERADGQIVALEVARTYLSLVGAGILQIRTLPRSGKVLLLASGTHKPSSWVRASCFFSVPTACLLKIP